MGIIESGKDNLHYSGQPSIVVCGWRHADYNVQAGYRIVSDFESRLSHLPEDASATLFLEGFGIEDIAGERDRASVLLRVGGLSALQICQSLAVQNGRVPTLDEIYEMYTDLDGLSHADVISRSLAESINVGPYLLYRELERLRREHRFDVRIEAHSKRALKSIGRKHFEAVDFYDQAERIFMSGNVATAVQMERKGDYRLSRGAIRAREPRIIKDIVTASRQNGQRPSPGLVYGIFGFSHTEMAEPISRKIGNDTKVITTSMCTHDMIPSLLAATRKPETVPDDVYARILLMNATFNALERYFLERSDTAVMFATHYEDIEAIVGDAIFDARYSDIEGLLEGGNFLNTGFVDQFIEHITDIF